MTSPESDTCQNDAELVLVTGASGYIATHIVQQLLQLGYRVRGTVRSLTNMQKTEPLRHLCPNSKHELELVEADLTDEASWLQAVKGCTLVLHTASPFPAERPKHENELIEPAVNGTLFVLRACVQEGSLVKRVVLTSSVAAVAQEVFENGRTYSEEDWPRADELTPYPKSKVLAEQAAWRFLEERREKGLACFELSVINPGFVMVSKLNVLEKFKE
jgi:nucleoside-diphosphate-sugar epimerase